MERAINFIHIGMVGISAVFAIIITFYQWKNIKKNMLLIIAFIVLAYGQFIGYIALYNQFINFPHLSRTGMLCVVLIPPLMFLSFKFHLKKRNYFKWFHFFLPLLYLINYLPYFILNREEKLIRIEKLNIGAYDEGFLPSFSIPIMAILQTSIYLILILKERNKLKNTNNSIKIFYLFVGVLIMHYIPISMTLLLIYDSHNIYHFLPITYSLGNLAVFFILLINPDTILNEKEDSLSMPLKHSAESNDLILKKIKEKRDMLKQLIYDDNYLNTDEKIIYHSIINHCKNPKVLTDKNINQKMLSEIMTTSEYKIRIILKKKNIKFTQLIHLLRIEYLLKNYYVKKFNQKNYQKIKDEIGYKSINTFFINFNLIIGTTPGDFFKKYEKR